MYVLYMGTSHLSQSLVSHAARFISKRSKMWMKTWTTNADDEKMRVLRLQRAPKQTPESSSYYIYVYIYVYIYIYRYIYIYLDE